MAHDIRLVPSLASMSAILTWKREKTTPASLAETKTLGHVSYRRVRMSSYPPLVE